MLDPIDANPGAIGAHYLWNARLFRTGSSSCSSTGIGRGSEPRSRLRAGHNQVNGGLRRVPPVDRFRRRRTGAALARSPSLVGDLARFPRLGLAGARGLAATAILAALWQRPRPEYLYALSVGILALVGACAMAYADRWPLLKRARAAIPLAAVLLVVFVPPRFTSSYVTPQVGRPGRPVKDMVDRLYPIRSELRGRK